MNVDTYIASLVQYGLDCGLLETCDRIYVTNQLLQALCLDSYTAAEPVKAPLEEKPSPEMSLSPRRSATRSSSTPSMALLPGWTTGG